MKILFLYSGRDGQTRKIAEIIAAELPKNITHDICEVKNLDNHLLDVFDAVIVGASVRYGRFSTEFLDFIKDNTERLNKMYSALFTVSLVARKIPKCTPMTNVYTRELLRSISWRPDYCQVFAGALRYSQYGWLDKQMIRIIMKLTGGHTNINKDVEYTDWAKVKTFTDKFLCQIK